MFVRIMLITLQNLTLRFIGTEHTPTTHSKEINRMGQRLSMQLVVGVADWQGVNDSRFLKPLDMDQVYEKSFSVPHSKIRVYVLCKSLGLDTDCVYWSDLLHIPTEDVGKEGLFGVRVAKEHTSDVFYALATLHTEYQEDGYKEVGKSTSQQYIQAYKPSKLSDNQGYALGLDWDFLMWLDVANELFNQIGFTVAPEDMRLYLEWNYA